MIDPKHLVLVARMLGGHGIQGYVKLKVFLETPQDLLKLMPLVTKDQEKSFSLTNLLERPKVILGRFKGVTTRTQADELKGVSLYGDSQQFSAPEPDSFYTKDLIGLQVMGQEKGPTLGTVSDIISQKSGDILIITTPHTQKEVLLPFRTEFFPTVVLTTSRSPGYVLIDPGYLHELLDA